MMRQMRENTKWIMLITAAAFVALMVFEWGMDASGGAMGMRDVGQVGGTSVSVERWQATYRNVYDQVQQTQDAPISSQQNREIEDMAWDEIVDQILIEQELNRRGIRVTDQEIREAARFSPPPALRNDPAFQGEDGQFDLNRYHQFLSSASTDPQFLLQLEQYYREVIPQSKLMRQLTAGIYVSDKQLWREWKAENEQVRARLLALNPRERIDDAEVEVSDAEVEAYYEENREEFAIPARAEVRYVTLTRAPTATDTAMARDRVEDLRTRLAEGEDFEEVAREESADQATAEAGGNLGTLTRGEGAVPGAVEAAVFSLPVGEVSDPVESGQGFHLIEVLSRDDDTAEARHIVVPIQRSDDSEFELLSRADSLEALGENLSLDEAAREKGLTVREGSFTEDFPILPGVGRASEGAHWVFDDMAAPGAISEVFEGSEAFYMLELARYSPSGYQSLEDTEPRIREILRAERKVERAREEAEELARSLREEGATLQELAEREGLTLMEPEPFTRSDFVPGVGHQNQVIGTAFGLPEGSFSRAVASEGNVFIVEVVERLPADEEAWEAQKEQQRARRINEIREDRLEQWLAGLRETVRIQDNRAEVFEMQEDLEDQPQMPMVF